jgi:hypothetical protein
MTGGVQIQLALELPNSHAVNNVAMSKPEQYCIKLLRILVPLVWVPIWPKHSKHSPPFMHGCVVKTMAEATPIKPSSPARGRVRIDSGFYLELGNDRWLQYSSMRALAYLRTINNVMRWYWEHPTVVDRVEFQIKVSCSLICFGTTRTKCKASLTHRVRAFSRWA